MGRPWAWQSSAQEKQGAEATVGAEAVRDEGRRTDKGERGQRGGSRNGAGQLNTFRHVVGPNQMHESGQQAARAYSSKRLFDWQLQGALKAEI